MSQLELRLPGVHKCAGDLDLRAGDRHPLLGTDFGDGRKIVCVRTTVCERNQTPWTWVCPEHVKGSGEPHPFDWSVLPHENEELAVDLAVGMLESLGHVEEADERLLEELRGIYRKGPDYFRSRISFREADPVYNVMAGRSGEWLARTWENEQTLRWQREQAPRFRCDYCGTEVGADETYWSLRGADRLRFYSLTEEGEWWDEVKTCPGCGRGIKDMIDRCGQLVIDDEAAPERR